MDWIDYLRFPLALILVLGLMGGLYLILKKFNLNGQTAPNSKRRLRIIESLPLDSRHRAILLQRDDKEHLVILSPTGETVVETRIETTSHDQTHS